MALAGVLRVLLTGDVSQLETDLQSVHQDAAKLGVQLRGTFDAATGSVGVFAAAMQNLPALLGGAALGAWVHETLQFADSLQDAADKLGLTTDAFQAYREQLQLAGGTSKQFETGMQHFITLLGQANAGSKEAQENFRKLGIAWAEGGGARETEAAFRDLIDRFKEIPNHADRAAMAAIAFGRRAGAVFAETYKGGTDAADEFERTQAELGRRLGPDVIQSLARLNDNLDMLKTSFMALSAVILDNFTPALNTMIGWVTKSVQALGGWYQLLKESLGLAPVGPITLALETAKAWEAIEDAKRRGVQDDSEEMRILREQYAATDALRRAAEYKAAQPTRQKDDTRPPVPEAEAKPGKDDSARAAREAERAANEARKLGNATLDESLALLDSQSAALQLNTGLWGAYARNVREGVTESYELGSATMNVADALDKVFYSATQLEPDAVATAFATIDKEAAALGESVNVSAAKMAVLEAAIKKLIADGVDPGNERLADLAARFRELRLESEIASRPQVAGPVAPPEFYEMQERMDAIKSGMHDVFDSISSAMSRSVTGVIQGTQTMQQAFAKMGESIVLSLQETVVKRGIDALKMALDELLKSQMVQALLQKAVGAVGSMFGGGGLSVNANQTIAVDAALAAGGIVQSPTVSLLGERGPEAVIPLDRLTHDTTPGTTVNIIDQRRNGNMEQTESQDANGQQRIDVLITDVVRGGLSTGAFDRALAGSFGIERRGASR